MNTFVSGVFYVLVNSLVVNGGGGAGVGGSPTRVAELEHVGHHEPHAFFENPLVPVGIS
jgi:hypothetical protein